MALAQCSMACLTCYISCFCKKMSFVSTIVASSDRPIRGAAVFVIITRTPMSENSSVLSPARTSWAGQNILISSRLRGTHCTTLHLNYTHNTARVMCSQHSTEYTGPRARASAALPTRGARAHRPGTLTRISWRRCRTSPGWWRDSKKSARKPL